MRAHDSLVGFGPVLSENADTNLASSGHLGQVLLHRDSNVAAGPAGSVAMDQLQDPS